MLAIMLWIDMYWLDTVTKWHLFMIVQLLEASGTLRIWNYKTKQVLAFSILPKICYTEVML
jgi:hypothetical protein